MAALAMLTPALIGCPADGGLEGAGWERPTRSQFAADRPESIADPTFLQQYARTRRFRHGQPTAVKVVPDGSAVLFLRSGARSPVQDLYEFDTSTKTERVLLTAEQILQGAAEQLSAEERARRERMRLSARGIASYKLSEDGTKVLVALSGRLFVVRRSDGGMTELNTEGLGYPLDARFSPDGRHVSCVCDGELQVIDLGPGRSRQLTSGAGAHVSHGLAEFVAQEEMGRFEGYWWSPDSKSIACQQTDTSAVETLHIADVAHPEHVPDAWPYPRAGRANASVRLGIIELQGGRTNWVSWDRRRYPYLATVRWKDRGPLTVLVQNREQTEELLLAVDPATGDTSPLLVERDQAWLNLDQQMPRWLSDGSAFLWTTERNGVWELELRSRDGRLIRRLAVPALRRGGLVAVDEEDRSVVVRAGEDPTQTHLYRVPLDASAAGPLPLSHEPGNHGAVFSKNGAVYVHRSESLTRGTAWVLHRRDGSVIGPLRSIAEEPPFVPNVELTTVGSTPTFHAALVRPRNFDPAVRYPVIVNVYAGPGGTVVGAARNSYLLDQWFADHGFIVVLIDGRGTPHRGRRWERAIKGNLINVPLKDQTAALQTLGRKYPELDLSRVGVYGWSFGGYFSAMAVMQRPDVYQVAVAGAPVADFQDYDTHYTERYLGLPEQNPEGYRRSSVLTYVKDLRRPLLIIHGTADDNVYLLHSLRLSDALLRAGKDHDFLALSGSTHMVPDPEVTVRLYERIAAFFQEHLVPES